MLPATLAYPRTGDWRRLLVTAGGGLLLSGLLAYWVQGRIEEQAQTRFEAGTARALERLQEHVDRHTLGLRGLRGVFLDDPEAVDAERFRRYVESRDLETEFPGGLAWGYVERLPGDTAADHLQTAHGLGYSGPESAIEPTVLRLIEPGGIDLPPRGRNLAGLPALAATLESARQAGSAELSPPLAWADMPASRGLLMVMPVYSGVRTPDNVRGWAVTFLDPERLLAFLAGEPGLADRVGLEVIDIGRPGEAGSAPVALFRLAEPGGEATTQPPGAPPRLTRSLKLDLYGRSWEVRFETRPDFYTPGERWLPSLVFGVVFLLGALATSLLLLRDRMRDEVELRAHAITAALRERKHLLQSTLAALPDPVVVLDADGVILGCHGAPGSLPLPPDCAGQPLRALLPALARAELDARLATAAMEGEARLQFEPEEAPPRRFDVRLCRRRDATGAIEGFTVTLRETSSEHEALEALRRDEEKYRQLFTEAPEAILIMSERRYLDANPSALRLLGVPSLTALQHVNPGMLSPLLQPDGRLSTDAGRQLMARTLADGPQHADWTYQRLSDSETFPAQVSTRALRLQGETCFLLVITDQSAQKRVEAALVQARDAAEAATREKADFLATMSHEIRTPMNGVLGMAQLLANTPLNQEQRDYLSTIQHSGQSLLTIINDILDFSKIEAGKLSFEEVPFDLQVAVEETCELLLPQLREKALALTLRLDPGTPFQVIGDPGRFRQILLNYLSNAIKFTAEGGITVALRAREQGRGAALLELSVADTGIGIDPAKQERLFQKFAQADASTTRKFGGTGLGLAICKALVERMGGEVSMTSTPGQGSVFRATFWMSLDPNAHLQPLPVPLPALRAGHVLVVDDNDACREPLVRGLHNAGLAASGVASLEEALEALHQFVPRFVLVDAELGDGDTARIAATLRAQPAMKEAALLALSARPDRNDHAFCREHGIAAWLPRPTRLSWVLTSLNILTHGEHEGVITRQTLVTHLARGRALPQLRRGIRVLLAEDNTVNQKVAARMLEKMGCHVDMAGNGLEAVVMVSQLPYDLVLMDVQMPEMDGITATRRLRAQGFTTLPIIALTANNREADRQECREAGMNDFLAKPIRYEDLHTCLSRWVRAARQPA